MANHYFALLLVLRKYQTFLRNLIKCHKRKSDIKIISTNRIGFFKMYFNEIYDLENCPFWHF